MSRRTVWVACRDMPIGTKLTAELAAAAFRRERMKFEAGDIAGPFVGKIERRVGHHLHADLKAGEPLRSQVLRKRRPYLPLFAIGQVVKLMRCVRVKALNVLLDRGTLWRVEEVIPHEELKTPPRYKLSVSIGGPTPIGFCEKPEQALRTA